MRIIIILLGLFLIVSCRQNKNICWQKWMKGKRFAYVRYGRRTRKRVNFRLYLNRSPFPLLWQLVHQPLDSWHSEACITEYSAMNNNPISFNDR